MTHLVVSRRRHPSFSLARAARHGVLGAAIAMALGSASNQALAAVSYTPVCLMCTVNTVPAEGDELVIRGLIVGFGADNLVSAGVLTNNAFGLTSSRNLHVMGGFNNNSRFSNTGSLVVAGLASPTFTNSSQFSNSGTLTLFTTLDNKAGRLVNSGKFAVNFGIVTNHSGATITNSATGSLTMTEGRLMNQANAVINNLGEVRGNARSAIYNQGTVNNQAGFLRMGTIVNTGVVNNASGATLSIGYNLVNEAGARLVNRGVIDVDIDARLVLNEGGIHDLKGGTINIGQMGRLYLNRDFTIGDVQSGQINLGFDGRIHNTANLRMTGAQHTIGDVFNTGSIANQGNWRHQGVLMSTAGTLSNSGQLTAEGFVRTASFTQTGGELTVVGDVSLGQATVQRGDIDVKSGGVLSADTLALHGGLIANGGSLRVRSLEVGQGGWLDLANTPLVVTGDFIDGGSDPQNWHTADARLSFEGEGLHRFGVGAGSRQWAELMLDASGSYEIFGGHNLSVGVFNIAGGDLSLLSAITSDATIYYDPTLAGNAYLNGQSYSFGHGSGQLVAFSAQPMSRFLPASSGLAITPVPEAEQWALALAGLAVLGLRSRRVRGARKQA